MDSARPAFHTQQDLADGQLLISFENGRFEASLKNAADELISVKTCENVKVEPDLRGHVVAVTWRDAQITALYMNGLPLEDNMTVMPFPTSGKLHQMDDFSAPSKKVHGIRKHKLDNWKRDATRTQGGAAYAFSSLLDEMNLLADALEAVGQGKSHHILNVYSRLRLLLIGQPMGLLQVCAAYLNAPLIVFTEGAPSSKLPIEPTSHFRFHLRPAPDQFSPNPIDMDCWLNLAGLNHNGRRFPNVELIAQIGNTIASHRDLDIPEVVVMMKSGKTGVPVQTDHLTRYGVMVGETVHALGRQLLALG